MDPVALQRRQGGRPNTTPFILRGLVFCGECGAAMYARKDSRSYVCRNKRLNTGTCPSCAFKAKLLERHVLDHLDTFVGSVEEWIEAKAAERGDEQQVRQAELDRQQSTLTALDRTRERHWTQYRQMVADGDRLARYALEEVERIDGARAQQQQAISEAEAVLSEWTGPPDVDAALDYYNQLVDLIDGRVSQAEGAEALNAALADVLAGIWVRRDGDRLHAEFELRVLPDDPTAPNGLAQVLSHDLAGRRMTLPDAIPGNPDEVELVRASLVKPQAQPCRRCAARR
jgi:hypothetical protein